MKKIITFFISLVFLAACSRAPAQPRVTSFAECEAAGYPIQESYPPVCVTPDGQSFTQDIGTELEYADEFMLDSPRPQTTITSPLTITGSARGSWFFEASFTAELYDANDALLGTAIVQATGEWMTTEFVPFTGTMTFRKPTTLTGTLKIKNANASGLPENEKVVLVPIKFE